LCSLESNDHLSQAKTSGNRWLLLLILRLLLLPLGILHLLLMLLLVLLGILILLLLVLPISLCHSSQPLLSPRPQYVPLFPNRPQ
jgi:sensor histidine kinase YesM